MKALRRVASAFLLPACSVAGAADWTVCDAVLHVLGHREGRLVARVSSLHPLGAGACMLQKGQTLDFAPETPDYQTMLPRSAWPKPGRKAYLRHRYLDGWCKREGATQACRIGHFSLMPRPSS